MKKKCWDELELAARTAVVAGGVAAMGYYRGAIEEISLLGEGKSPATVADTQATLAILRSLDPILDYITGNCDCGHSYFAEELEMEGNFESVKQSKREEEINNMLNQLGLAKTKIKRTAENFQESFEKCIAVLIDGLDGTTNFRAGIPLFCSAIAFFIDGEPCVGAIYDPHHHVVYYGSIRDDNSKKAYMWDVQSGNNINLSEMINKRINEIENHTLIGVHLTRTNQEKREIFVDKLKFISECFSSIYMLNSGQLALAYVANGNLSGFINNQTNIWDVAAGDVLVRAIGGKITDFNNQAIQYGDGKKVEVIAASTEKLHEKIIQSIH